ncbi:class I SAM-dependent methyltransferase [Rhodospirillum sp. A1_3_36]|uniref:class I SAM-dependent methyltransferase n=1 Tax=Rhodospirillum sp. A1_3_36 TaxID=3391666 RepID=UPI0039A4A4F6
MASRKSASTLVLALSALLPGAEARQPWSRGLARLAGELRIGRLTLETPNGERMAFTGRDSADGPRGVLTLRSDKGARAMFTGGEVGFAQAYIDGYWDSPDLTALIRLAAVNQNHIGLSRMGLAPAHLVNRLRHLSRPNSKKGAKRNIAYHYDLGNAFYAWWLDPSMTYSSALFETGEEHLVDAQRAKYHALARELDLKPGMSVLEIGCGWGGFAEVAAKDYGAKVVGITLSKEQLAYAQERINRAGLAEQVELRLQDYRDVPGQFDRIASIEMFEAVGEEHWSMYFDVIKDRLRPGGRAALQVITIAEDRFETYRTGADFIQTHIFPGGMLPTVPLLRERITQAGLQFREVRRFGESYARTLALWQRDFQRSWGEIARMPGFDRSFKRMWEYYLAYCEAGFSEGSIDVGLHLALKPQ